VAPPSDQHEYRPGPIVPGREVAASPADTIEVILRPDWVAPSVVRDRLTNWLRSNRWPPGNRDDLVLAVSEAVTNSVEHGYAVSPDTVSPDGAIEVGARILTTPDGARTAEVIVVDHGRWRPPGTTGQSSRGHGLEIMRACVRDLSLETTADGTTIRLTSRSVPPPAWNGEAPRKR
jgi:anti-sigma regulatory factor (Ser/Thr protein kinase)